MCRELSEIVVNDNNIFIFYEQFLNKDISVVISNSPLKFSTCIHEIEMEGIMSQNFDLGPSFNFIKCRKLHLKKIQKVTQFLR